MKLPVYIPYPIIIKTNSYVTSLMGNGYWEIHIWIRFGTGSITTSWGSLYEDIQRKALE